MNKQELPKWFNGTKYKKGSLVTNPFSGKTYTLNNKELSMYDLIMGEQYLLDVRGYDKNTVEMLQKAISWFRKNNTKAYMVLLD